MILVVNIPNDVVSVVRFINLLIYRKARRGRPDPGVNRETMVTTPSQPRQRLGRDGDGRPKAEGSARPET